LSFDTLAGTRMACPPAAMELERRLYAALGLVTGYSIDGEVLTLHAPDRPVARLERYLELFNPQEVGAGAGRVG
jgi:heat shock protein HslJ